MSKPKLLVIGCGNIGGFIANNLRYFNLEDLDFAGFIDEDKEKIGESFFGYPVVGDLNHLIRINYEVHVVIAIGNPGARSEIKKRLKSNNIKFPNMISRHSWISENVKIGDGVIIYPGASINYNVNIGNFVIINMNCAVGHDCTISDFSTLAPGVSLGGLTYIEKEVDMGINAATKQSIRIGESSIVGGMSMVIDDIPEGSTVVGVPAKIIKQNHNKRFRV